MLYLAKFILKTYTPFASTQISLENRLVEADSIDEAKEKVEKNFTFTPGNDEKQKFIEDLEVFEIIR
jgi:hypothetical protein